MAIDLRWIMNLLEHVQQMLVADGLRSKSYLNHFSMAGAVSTHPLIQRVFGGSTHLAGCRVARLPPKSNLRPSLERLATGEAGQVADNAHSMPHKYPLERRRPVNRRKPDIAGQTNGPNVVGK